MKLLYNLEQFKVSNTYPLTTHFNKTHYYKTNDQKVDIHSYPYMFNFNMIKPIKLKNEGETGSIHFLQYHLWGDYYLMFMINENGVFRTVGHINQVKVFKEYNYQTKPYQPRFYFLSTDRNNEIVEGEIEVELFFKPTYIPYMITLYSQNVKQLRDNLIKSASAIDFKINDFFIEDINNYEGVPCSENYRNATTQKPKTIYNTLINRPLNSYVLFLDCDTMLYEDREKWNNYFMKLREMDCDIIFQKDQSYPFNSGFQYIRNTEHTRAFYKQVLNYFNNENCDYGNFTYDQEIMTVYLYHSGLKWCCADPFIIAGNPSIKDFHKSEKIIENALFYHTYGVEEKGVGLMNDKLRIMTELNDLKTQKNNKNSFNIFNMIMNKNL